VTDGEVVVLARAESYDPRREEFNSTRDAPRPATVAGVAA